jgi:hypothetical protein
VLCADYGVVSFFLEFLLVTCETTALL